MSTMNVQKPRAPQGGFARGLGKFRGFREGTTILIILVLGVIMSFLSPVFLTGENFSTMFKIFAINGLVVIGMTLVMIGGGIDLSVAAVMALVGVVSGQLFLVYHWDIWAASLAGLVVGTVVGYMNGYFVTRVGL
jgi:ribose transport system permease protein